MIKEVKWLILRKVECRCQNKIKVILRIKIILKIIIYKMFNKLLLKKSLIFKQILNLRFNNNRSKIDNNNKKNLPLFSL